MNEHSRNRLVGRLDAMNKALLAFVGLLQVAAPIGVSAEKWGDFTYSTDGTVVTITGYTGSGGAVSIPDTVDGKPVVRIGEGAFYACAGLTSVGIPGSAVDIGGSAFFGCTNLAEVVIPHAVTNVGNSAFYSCGNLTNAAIGDGVITIGDYAFASCGSLARAAIGSGVTSIGYGAFTGSGLTAVTIPDGVRTIGDAAFEYCGELASVGMGSGVTKIADFTFDGCASLTTAVLSSSLTRIGIDAFGRCTSLTRIVIPAGVTSIGDVAFLNCTNLSGVHFRSKPPTLGTAVFSGAEQAVVYYLPGTTGWGSTFGGRPTALWPPEVLADDGSFGVRTNQFGFTVTWAAGQTVVVEACSSLTQTAWISLQTNVLTTDSLLFVDPERALDPARFYRARSP